MALFNWILGCEDYLHTLASSVRKLSPQTVVTVALNLWSLINKGSHSSAWFSAGSLTGVQPFLMFLFIPCSSRGSRNPECLCLL